MWILISRHLERSRPVRVTSLILSSHELRIDFRCKGSCKGPYNITAVSDYNARYNVTLYSFFINATITIDKMAYVPRLQQPITSWRLMLLSWQQHFLFNIVFITLISPGGLLAKKGEQDIFARNAQQPYRNIFLSAKTKLFFSLLWFFFSALALLQKCK